MNSIEQHVVVKGGSVCLFGTAENGYQWSNLGGDYLLSRLLIAKKIKRVLCLNLDRNPTSLTEIVNLVRESSDHSEESTAEMTLLGSRDFDSQNGFDGKSILSSIEETTKNWQNQELTYAIVVYSLSELILTLGLRKAVTFAKDLIHFLQSELADGSAKSVVSANPTVVFIVHESLHSTSVITQLQSLASIIVKVVPNSGTLASEVVAEMQTIRKSATTGKIVECIEMFGYREGLLYPMKTNNDETSDLSNAAGDVEEDAANDSNSSTKNNSSVIMSKLLSSDSNAATTASATVSTSVMPASPSAVVVDTSKRLITFDSTDPEFDEDSDPDADLDL